MPAQLYDTCSGATYALDPSKRFIIGRSVTCDLRLAADGVQRTHTHLEAEPAERGVVWYVCDRGTVCGSFLNGKQVAREALRTGDVIGLADRARFVFTTDDPPPPPPPAPEPPPPLDPQLGAPIEALREIAADILARYGIDTPSSHRAAPLGTEARAAVLQRRAFAALTRGESAAPDAALLAESAQHATMFVLRNEAAVLRDEGHSGARAVLRRWPPPRVSPWLHAFCAKAPPPEPADVTGEVAAVVAALRATPVDDVEERAALRRRLDDLLGHNRAHDR